MKKLYSLWIIWMLVILPTCAEEAQTASREVFTMDTYVSISCTGIHAAEAADCCVEELQRLNALLSVGEYDSEIAVINREFGGYVSADTAAILNTALSVWRTTNGAFDISVYPLMELWGFTTGNFYLPNAAEVETVLKNVNAGNVRYDSETGYVSIGAGQGIDFGGIAKGYASDRMMEIFARYDILSGYANLGGNVQCYGHKTDGSLWVVGIQNPHDATSIIGTVSVADKACITSGAYQRYFTDDNTGKTYHHIIDPATGYPSDSDLISVTVVSPHGVLADALSTACFIMGKDASLEYWKTYGEDFELILMTENDLIYFTEGLEQYARFHYPATIVRK